MGKYAISRQALLLCVLLLLMGGVLSLCLYPVASQSISTATPLYQARYFYSAEEEQFSCGENCSLSVLDDGKVVAMYYDVITNSTTVAMPLDHHWENKVLGGNYCTAYGWRRMVVLQKCDATNPKLAMISEDIVYTFADLHLYSYPHQVCDAEFLAYLPDRANETWQVVEISDDGNIVGLPTLSQGEFYLYLGSCDLEVARTEVLTEGCSLELQQASDCPLQVTIGEETMVIDPGPEWGLTEFWYEDFLREILVIMVETPLGEETRVLTSNGEELFAENNLFLTQFRWEGAAIGKIPLGDNSGRYQRVLYFEFAGEWWRVLHENVEFYGDPIRIIRLGEDGTQEGGGVWVLYRNAATSQASVVYFQR